MKKSHLAILAAVAGIAVIGGYIATRSRLPLAAPMPNAPIPDAAAPSDREDRHGRARSLLPGLRERVGDVSKLVIRSGAATTELVKASDTGAWTIASKADYPADPEAVRDLLAGLAQATIIEEKTSKPDLYARIGVEGADSPEAKSTLVSVFDGDGAPLGALLVGNPQAEQGGQSPSGPTTPRRFVRLEGEAQSYLAGIDAQPRAEATAWAQTRILEIASERVKAASFAVPTADGAPTTTAMSRSNNTETAYAVDNLPVGRSLKDEYAAGRAAQMLSYLTFEDVRRASELAWDGPGVATATFTLFDGTTVTVKSMDEGGQTWHHIAAAYQPPPEPIIEAPPAAAPAPSANAEMSLDAPIAPAPAPAPPVLTPEEQATKDSARAAHDRLSAEAAAINARLAPWAFRVQEFKAKQLRTTMEDLLAPAASEPPSALVPKAGSLLLPQ